MADVGRPAMGEPHNKLSEETVDEIKNRLADGESPSDICEDDEMPSRRKIYDIKDELEAEQERRKEMEKEVFRSTTDADRDDIIEVLDTAGVGIKQDGSPKAKVDRALNAIEMDGAWDDMHYVADTLVDEAGMTREWANRVVRKAYDAQDFPYVSEDDRDGQSGGGRHRRKGRGGGRGQREDSRSDRRGRRDRGRRGRDDNDQSGDPQLRREMQQLRSTVSELAETVTEVVQEDDDDDGQMVTIEQDGKTMTVPYHVAVSQNLLGGGGGDDKDFMDKLREAKEAGIIPDPEDFQQDDDNSLADAVAQLRELGIIGDDSGNEEVEAMMEMMDDMGEKFAEAQESTAAQMSAAISQLADESDGDSDELTMDDLREFWEEKEKEDRIDKLAEELDKTREDLRKEMRKGSRTTSSPENSEDVVMQRDKLEHEKDQLQMVNDTLQTLPEQLASSVQEGILPLYKELNLNDGGGSSPIWTPPGAEQQGQPEYAPTQQQPQEERTPAQDQGYPDESGGRDVQEAEDEIRERASNVREQLGLEDDEDAEGAEA